MDRQTRAAIAVNRFGLGAKPGELADAVEAADWLEAQLEGGAPTFRQTGLASAARVLQEAREQGGDSLRAVVGIGRAYRDIYLSEVTARVCAAVATSRPFVERLTHFWSNHFAVSVDKAKVLGIAGAFEREAIRPHVLGRFGDMLAAVERHPAMLIYLDNTQSIGPSSPLATLAARRSERTLGLNENLAREILELHTLGVDGGYTQDDVLALAAALTGWSIGGTTDRRPGLERLMRRFGVGVADGEPGTFMFREALHEPGSRTVLGKRYRDDGVGQAEAVLADLAVHPSTARHVATKLARHFVADDPPESIIERLSRAFLDSGGDLPTVYRALIASPEAWASPFAKYKTPNDYVISAYRGLGIDVVNGNASVGSLEVLGQRAFAPGSPAGWPDRSEDWDGASALLQRVEWAHALAQRIGSGRSPDTLARELLGGVLSDATRVAVARAATAEQALTLLLTSPEFLRR